MMVLLQIKREIGTLKLLKHPNVVRLYEVFDNSSSFVFSSSGFIATIFFSFLYLFHNSIDF